jgi:hypothetical protein
VTPDLIGGVGLTHLKVYDTPGPDGVKGGCAHVHALTDEAYFCFGGKGHVELHDVDSGFRIVALEKGSFVQFSPNTLHRSVCHDGMEILAIMGNSGLPERGDARIYFGQEVDEDPNKYAQLSSLAKEGELGAMKRRDISAIAYGKLMGLWDTDRDLYMKELDRFFSVHRKVMFNRKDELTTAVINGAAVQASKDQRRLTALPDADSQLESWTAFSSNGKIKLGMCGTLAQIEKLKKV